MYFTNFITSDSFQKPKQRFVFTESIGSPFLGGLPRRFQRFLLLGLQPVSFEKQQKHNVGFSFKVGLCLSRNVGYVGYIMFFYCDLWFFIHHIDRKNEDPSDPETQKKTGAPNGSPGRRFRSKNSHRSISLGAGHHRKSRKCQFGRGAPGGHFFGRHSWRAKTETSYRMIDYRVVEITTWNARYV